MRDKLVPVYKSGVFRKFDESTSAAYRSRGIVFDNTSLIRVGDVLPSTLKFVITLNDQYDENVRKYLNLRVT
jgi:hypothetical protein